MILKIRDLRVEFDTYGGTVQAVRGVDLDVPAATTVAIVGESGCGKSVTMQSILGLTPMPPGRIVSGSAKLNGQELIGLPLRDLNRIRGNEVGFIFQDPMTSLNPTIPVGKQIAETVRVHQGYSRDLARAKAIEMLKLVQIPEAELRVDAFPFQFSGGMRQRVMIAAALAADPALLIADEPTTALDVSIQAQILTLLRNLQKTNGMAIVLITHDLGVVAQMAESVAVMYAGMVVEKGKVDDIFFRSAHPYTRGLKAAMPSGVEAERGRLVPIPGAPPDLFRPPAGCGYYVRCPYAMNICARQNPPAVSVGQDHSGSCWLHHPQRSGGIQRKTSEAHL